MLNNNAELDNGVYNDNDEDDKPAGKKEDDDGLVGLNQQIQSEPTEEHLVEDQVAEGKPSAPASYLQSLNTSQEILDDDKIEQMLHSFRYPPDYTRQQLLDDKLNHCTTTYFLID
jgi:hypothetical protein|tara:strand:+ start:1015 stop:1359 length:345 start_codon:yes stop_codon:yes gene_type:complete